jgi:inward rectifier potassium channel
MLTELPPRPLQALNADGTAAGPSVETVGLKRDRLGDLYHTLLSTSWPRLIALLAVGWVATNALFALLFVLGGDTILNAEPGSIRDAFFFSVQTSATIGYGGMMPKTLYGHILVTAISFVSILQNAMATGLMFAKFARPSARILFSERPVIFHRDGVNLLSFRLANGRLNQVVEGKVKLAIARNQRMSDGERMRRIVDLQLIRSESPIFTLTFLAQHVMDEQSPLWGETPESLAASEAQLIVTFTGIDESFSSTIHARHTYSWRHLAWGYRYADIISLNPGSARRINFAVFHDVEESSWLG